MATTELASSDQSDVVLAAHALSKHFRLHRGRRRLHAVDGVDLALRRGRVVALVGESGSGKSTVARLLAQLHPATSGEVRLHGRPVKVRAGRRFRAYARRVQLILQDPFASLNPIHTVRYVLTRSLKIHHPGIKGEALEQGLTDLLTKVHLQPDRFLDKFPHELSGGQRQRVSIARALGATPEVLLADEPVSMLDVSIRLGVLNLLSELKNDMNLAILYITHDIASARYFSDETIVMYAGQVVERGDSETVTQRPAHPYTRLLIASAPDPDNLAAAPETNGAKGEPPSLIDPPPGCRFQPRCPRATARCATESPPSFPVSGTQEAACWLFAPAGGNEEVPR
ncbi:peptide/nickel transport system ATP-binding protein [Stackebrandtia albiflava]|uniref:Peptide/nickel transport system ATP-binding protein n=1 Tax=Stackebrandtia albiflava TaxID=406432 RepID=A0A562VE68_9ACTN|nr:ABC transporter ATP-binding protein [Stackebrandtia albiflava]TWJ16158.1 peptide/nickel transport system ATP-binding protein [Stackebrandtia albiflava]